MKVIALVTMLVCMTQAWAAAQTGRFGEHSYTLAPEQRGLADSVLNQLRQMTDSREKIRAMCFMVRRVHGFEGPSILLLRTSLGWSQGLGWKDGVDSSEWHLGAAYYLSGELDLAKYHFERCGTAGPENRSSMQMALLYTEANLDRDRQRLYRNMVAAGLALTIILATVAIVQARRIRNAKAQSDALLLNILPAEVAEELKAKGSAHAKQFDEVTVMFTDFKNFTQVSEKFSPAELVAEIHDCFTAFDHIIHKYGIEKIKTIGDAYMCASGLTHLSRASAVDVVRAAIEIRQFIYQRMQTNAGVNRWDLEIRIGIHTGTVVAGIVGVKKFAYDIWGDAVNIAARMESSGEAGKINISGSTYELVKDSFHCNYRGKIPAKNKGEIDMYFVEGEAAI